MIPLSSGGKVLDHLRDVRRLHVREGLADRRVVLPRMSSSNSGFRSLPSIDVSSRVL